MKRTILKKRVKAIILTAGKATRLWPVTSAVSKGLIPVGCKPMIFYALSSVIYAGATDILIICSEQDLRQYQRLLSDGSVFGVNIEYAVQKVQRGVADAFIVGEEFIGDDDVILYLGDNIFIGEHFEGTLWQATASNEAATVMTKEVPDPERFGVVELNDKGEAIGIEEKPQNPRSNLAAVGLYWFDNDAIGVAKNQGQSARGELEITDTLLHYLYGGALKTATANPTTFWGDAGTFDSLKEVNDYIDRVQQATGLLVGDPTIAALEMGRIGMNEIKNVAAALAASGYGERLLRTAERSEAIVFQREE